MKTWSRRQVQQALSSHGHVVALTPRWLSRQTLSETVGGAGEQGAQAVGLTGTIAVEFSQGNDTVATKAYVGQPLSEVCVAWRSLRALVGIGRPGLAQVAAQAGQYIKYKCRKGECGTCEVRVDGKWIRTCSSQACSQTILTTPSHFSQPSPALRPRSACCDRSLMSTWARRTGCMCVAPWSSQSKQRDSTPSGTCPITRAAIARAVVHGS